MISWATRLLALVGLYLAIEGLVDLLLPTLARPVGRWLSRQRSPLFLVMVWVLTGAAMAGAWLLGTRGVHVTSASALFIAAGACGVVATIGWWRTVGDPTSR